MSSVPYFPLPPTMNADGSLWSGSPKLGQPADEVLGDCISRSPESRRCGAMSYYGLPERSANSGDVIAAWVLYAVIIFTMIVF